MIQVLKYWSQRTNLAIIMPKLAYQTAKNFLPEVNLFYFSSNEKGEEIKNTVRLMFAYVVRIVKSLFLKPTLKPDVIITASHFLYDVLPGVVLRKRYNSKLVVYCHGTLQNLRTDNKDLRSHLMILNEKLSLYFCKRWADRIFAISNETRNFLVYHGFQQDRISIIRNGVDHDFIDSINGTGKKYQACFCGRLVKRKGVYDLLEIWGQVLIHFPKGVLLIIGQGQEYEGLEKYISDHGWEKNIILTGYVPEDKKIAFLKESEIFIFPSYEEAWGIAITEAMACGTPVICYDLPAYNLIKVGIIKSALGDKESMSSLIVKILSDEKRRKLLAKDATSEAKKFDWREVAQEELSFVDGILNL